MFSKGDVLVVAALLVAGFATLMEARSRVVIAPAETEVQAEVAAPRVTCRVATLAGIVVVPAPAATALSALGEGAVRSCREE
jgi:hypothetical protein